jgi:putative phosphoesterase
MTRIGLISDTHGLLRPQALAALQDVAHIVHGGDVGGAGVLLGLATIAPVTAVRGNNDCDAWGLSLPAHANLEIGGISIHVLHDIADFVPASVHAARVVVVGHSHKPAITERDGLLIVNPGSAGPRRFRLPISVAMLEIRDGRITARLVELDLAPAA